LERSDELDGVDREPDLLFGFAQRGGAQVGFALIAAAARERDLARVAAEIVTAAGENRVELALVEVERYEDRRLGAAADVDLQSGLLGEQDTLQLFSYGRGR
jgi:hypothetical protein